MDPNDTKAARLNAAEADCIVGTSLMLRVMPGDRFAVSADAFYQDPAPSQGTVPADVIIVSSLTDVMVSDLTLNGLMGAQKLSNALSGTNYAISDLSKSPLFKGVTIEGAGRALGIGSAAYNVIKLVNTPSWGRGLETVVSVASLMGPYGWAIGATYFALDLAWMATHDGKSIATSIDESINESKK